MLQIVFYILILKPITQYKMRLLLPTSLSSLPDPILRALIINDKHQRGAADREESLKQIEGQRDLST